MTSTDLFEIERSLWNNDPVLYHETLRPDALLVFREIGTMNNLQRLSCAAASMHGSLVGGNSFFTSRCGLMPN